MLRGVLTVGGWTMVSRILEFARDMMIAAFLGTVFGQTATSRAAGQADGGSSTTALARSNTTAGGTRTAFALAADCSASDFCDTTARRLTAWAQGFGGVGSIDANATSGASRVNLNSAGGAFDFVTCDCISTSPPNTLHLSVIFPPTPRSMPRT